MYLKFLKISIPLFWIVYVSAGYLSQDSKEGEIYPFFSWQLFTYVPARVNSEFSIQVIEFAGRKIDLPRPFSAGDGFLSGQNQPTEYWLMFSLLGRAVQAQDDAGIKRYRLALEQNFISSPVRYELVLVTKDVIEYRNTGKYIKIVPLASFNTN